MFGILQSITILRGLLEKEEAKRQALQAQEARELQKELNELEEKISNFKKDKD